MIEFDRDDVIQAMVDARARELGVDKNTKAGRLAIARGGGTGLMGISSLFMDRFSDAFRLVTTTVCIVDDHFLDLVRAEVRRIGREANVPKEEEGLCDLKIDAVLAGYAAMVKKIEDSGYSVTVTENAFKVKLRPKS